MSDTSLDSCTWTNALDLGIRGQGWQDASREQPFDRTPASLKPNIDEPLWNLFTTSAGQYVDFHTSSTNVFVRWKLQENDHRDPYMSDCGRSGVDLYGRLHNNQWRWVGAKDAWEDPNCSGRCNRNDLDGAPRDYRLYLPILRRVLSMEVGTTAPIHAVAPDPRPPIAYYGTSIVHGAGMGRAGMGHASQLGRLLNREVLNLGVCGRANCEPAVAEALSHLDPVLFILDVLPNNGASVLRERIMPLVRRLRESRSNTPILLLGDRVFGDATFQPERGRTYDNKNRELDQLFRTLKQEGSTHLHLALHSDWYGEDSEGTNDGSHPNSLGASRMAHHLAPIVQGIIG